MPERLTTSFFLQDVREVARQLLGKVIVHQTSEGIVQGIITETEAYGGTDDPASHAFQGKGKRNWPMFGEPGMLYVYLIYGIHLCLNVVVEEVDQPAAVLIRSVQLLPENKAVTGPGRVTKELKISLNHNGIQSVISQAIWFEERGIIPTQIRQTSRIGIKKATDKEWRYIAQL
jgi:DNA-3-methyladenine glycosylase